MNTALHLEAHEPSVVGSTVARTLSERAMVVALNLSMWQGQRIDRQTTKEVLEERKAEPDAGRFEKNLVPPAAIRRVKEAQSQARATHYRLTLPWSDGGQRILASTAFFDYSNAMANERSNCELAYRDFIDRYPDLKANAAQRLGAQLYKASDFPSEMEISRKFGFELSIMPVPSKEDFRVDVGEVQERKIRDAIEQTVTARFADAQKDLWDRLFETVEDFALTMSEDKKVFRNTKVTNLIEIAQLAPKLTLVPNPKIDAICQRILTLTSRVTPDLLRESTIARSTAAKDAHAALKEIEDAMQGAF